MLAVDSLTGVDLEVEFDLELEFSVVPLSIEPAFGICPFFFMALIGAVDEEDGLGYTANVPSREGDSSFSFASSFLAILKTPTTTGSGP